MYISSRLILGAIEELKRVHPFHGITFLVCKGKNLPIDNPVDFTMDSLTREHMNNHHKLAPASNFYFQPFGPNNKFWLKHDYPSSGLQAINTQTFKAAFIHDPGSKTWAWNSNYLSVLEAKLLRRRKIPAWALAVWLHRSRDWSGDDNLETIVSWFVNKYKITVEEYGTLFSDSIPEDLIKAKIFVDDAQSWDDLKHGIELPPDAPPERGGTLASLHVHGTGPADDMFLQPARRLTIITGDNGLGKSFLMECAWWALTGSWASHPAIPRPAADEVYIKFGIQGSADSPEEARVDYDWNRFGWPASNDSKRTIPGLVIYARVDGSFDIWDPIRSSGDNTAGQDSFTLSSDHIWDGRSGMNEGLIRDWVKWQNTPDRYPFETLTNVLKRLSPPDLGELKAGKTIRIPHDPREIPTVVHRYGPTPVLYASAGVKRILALSYLMVWAWNEHLVASELARRSPENRMVILVDEMEAHLHPKWQRMVLPALSSIGACLERDLTLQLLVATHSPLVVASAEPIFDSDEDSLIHLDVSESGEVGMEEVPFTKHGDVSSWLTSPIFQLSQARSREAESAIEEAKALQIKEDVAAVDVERASRKLIEHLPSNDRFWPRWIAFAERYGVEL